MNNRVAIVGAGGDALRKLITLSIAAGLSVESILPNVQEPKQAQLPTESDHYAIDKAQQKRDRKAQRRLK